MSNCLLQTSVNTSKRKLSVSNLAMSRPRIPSEHTADQSILAERIRFRCGKITQNRIVKAPMSEQFFTWHDTDLKKRGLPTERVINTYEKWGHGGYGMIVSGNVIVDPYHLEVAGNCIISKENDSPTLRHQLRKWSTAAKADGALAILQLNHAGRMTPKSLVKNPLAPSSVQLEGFGEPLALTEAQVQTEVIDRFVFAAKVAHDVGFDGVEIPAPHFFLLGQFLSSAMNLRTDKYGGDMEKRQRVIHDIYHAIRETLGSAGKDFVIGIKIMSYSFQFGDLNLGDAEAIAKKVVETGFDYAHLAGGTLEKSTSQIMRDSTKKREDFYLDFSDRVAPIFKSGGVKIYSTGGFRTAAGMVEAIKNDYTDLIGIARPTAAEPDLARKLVSGHVPSTVASKFDDNDFGLTQMAARTQIYQMGEESFKEVNNDLGADISDFTLAEEADQYKKELAAYQEFLKINTEASKNVPNLFPYKITVIG